MSEVFQIIFSFWEREKLSNLKVVQPYRRSSDLVRFYFAEVLINSSGSME